MSFPTASEMTKIVQEVRRPEIEAILQRTLTDLKKAFTKTRERRVWVVWYGSFVEDEDREARQYTEEKLKELGYACRWYPADEDDPERIIVWIP